MPLSLLIIPIRKLRQRRKQFCNVNIKHETISTNVKDIEKVSINHKVLQIQQKAS